MRKDVVRVSMDIPSDRFYEAITARRSDLLNSQALALANLLLPDPDVEPFNVTVSKAGRTAHKAVYAQSAKQAGRVTRMLWADWRVVKVAPSQARLAAEKTESASQKLADANAVACIRLCGKGADITNWGFHSGPGYIWSKVVNDANRNFTVLTRLINGRLRHSCFEEES